MRKSITLPKLLLAGLLCLSVVACKKEETTPNDPLPATNVTTYTGDLSYTPTAGLPITVTDGTVTIVESNDTYTFNFSDGVPSLSGLQFSLSNGEYVSISGNNSFAGISVDGDNLDIGVTQNSNNWAFSGTK